MPSRNPFHYRNYHLPCPTCRRQMEIGDIADYYTERHPDGTVFYTFTYECAECHTSTDRVMEIPNYAQ